MAPALLQAATLALRAAGTCSSQPVCPQEDKCNYVTNNKSFEVNCATDFYGGDLKVIQTSTLADCINSCGTTDTCVAISYVGQNCYMKSTLKGGVSNKDVTGAYLPASVTLSSSAAVSTPTPASSSSTSAAAPAVTTTSSVIVTTSSTSVIVTTTASGPAASATSGSICPSTYTCPENDGCKKVGSDGRTFVLACGTDIYGSDYSDMPSNSLGECTGACASNSQCVAASYVGGKSPGHCYLKSKNNGATQNANVDAFYYDANAGSFPSSSSAAASTSASSSTPVAAPSNTPAASSSTPAASSSPSPSVSPQPNSTPKPSDAPRPSAIPQPAPQPSPQPSAAPQPTPDRNPAQTPTPSPSQAIVNPSFENGLGGNPDAWSYVSNNAVPALTGRTASNARSGSYSFQAYGSSSYIPWSVGLTQNLVLVAGKSYSVQFFAKQAFPGNCRIDINFNGVLIAQTAPVPLNLYTQSVGVIPGALTPRGGGSLTFSAYCGVGGTFSSLWIDDVTVTAL